MSGLGLRWSGLLIVVAGAVLHAVASWHEAALLPAETAEWVARSKTGELLNVPRDQGLVIGPGDVLKLKPWGENPLASEEVRLRVQRTGRQSSAIRVRARDNGVNAYRLLVVPGPPLSVTLSAELAEGEPVNLGSAQLENPRFDPAAPIALTWRLAGAHQEVAIDGQTLLQADDTRIGSGTCNLRADGVRVLQLGLDRRDATGEVKEYDIDLAEWQATEAARRRSLAASALLTAATVLLSVAAMAGLLRALCRGRPSLGRTLQAALLALSPLAVLVGLGPLLKREPSPLLLSTSLAAGTILGLFVLAGERTDAARRPRTAWIALAVGLLWIAVTAGAVAAWRWAQIRPLVAEEQLACAAPAAAPWERLQPARLDASNALIAPGPYRSLVWTSTVELEPSSWLELRCRSQSSAAPQGVALFLGSDARMPTGFVDEGDENFTPIGNGSGPLPAGRPLELVLRAEGSHWEARVDGKLIAEADERRHPAGSVVALAADGAVTLSRTSLLPSAHEPPVGNGLGEASLAGAWWLAIGLLLALVGSLVLRLPWTSAPAIAGWALAVPAFALVTSHGGPLPIGTWSLAAAGGVAVLIAASLLHGRLPFGVLLAPVGALLILAGLLAVAGKPAPPPELVGLPVDGFDLPRLSPGLAHVQHPGLRRLNTYLVDHSFRGRRFTLRKPRDTVRVACLGTSTTWGYGLDESQSTDFPSVLQTMLNQQSGGPRVEVINAGVRGWTAPRMRRLFEEVVAEFEPDVVTLSLYYNDAIHATVEDEEEWLTLRTRKEFESDWTDCFSGILELRTGMSRLADLHERIRIDRVDSRTAWLTLDLPRTEPTPPERFERSLRQLAAAVRSTGAALVLAKEPVSGRALTPWRDEIYAVIDRVGAEAEAPVVELAPALQAAGGAALYMDDIYLLPNGNRIVASQLAPVIQELLAQKSRGETGGAAGEPVRVTRFR